MINTDFQPLAAIATTPTAVHTLHKLTDLLPMTLWVPPSLHATPGTLTYEGNLKLHLANLWDTQQAFVFVLATGAVVRLIAPLLRNKTHDPAVVVIDETGTLVISLCGGHQGGADSLTRLIATQLNAVPVLTGASHALDLTGIDILGTPFGWNRGSGNWTGLSAAIARQEPVQIIQEAGTTLWQEHLPEGHTFQLGWPEETGPGSTAVPQPQARLWISPIRRRFDETSSMPKAQWHPRVLWVGVGCERGTDRQVIEQGIAQVCQRYHLAEEAIAGIATLELKLDEPGLMSLCGDRHWPLRGFRADQLRSIPVPTPSPAVEQEVGTPSVAEAAALLAARQASLMHRLTPTDSPELAFEPAHAELRVTKQVVRLEGYQGAATVAIAQAEQEFTGRTGRLWLVGTGPGQLSQMTQAAQAAVGQADAVIGYELYVDLVRSLLRPGQIVEALPITQERQRALRAIELAQWGLTVAVISSGDCGIYGMAGLVLEQLQAQGWDGKTPEVDVFPGVSAFQAAAARVGAPLMHDFCAISLSDLLTPWPVIEKRLEAAAQADFVTAIYNPKSKTRTDQIAIAQSIFLKHRSPETPVAIVRSAYRQDEQLTLTTLAEFLNFPIDMVTVLLIGNQSTQEYHHWLITPRGYRVSS